ncbi:MAG: hypothetical protein V4563_14065 [Pseudomonadota bacterium]
MPNPDLQSLIDETADVESVLDSATTFITGVPALIDTAVKAAVANGATEAELKPLAQLSADLKTKADAVKAAIAANTTA